MGWFIARRLIVSFFVLLASTFLMYVLTALSGDPLADTREMTGPQREQRIAELTERLNLETPVPLRYLMWLGGLFRGDLGLNREGQEVSTLLTQAMSSTLQLVMLATVLALFVGILIGIISALRQYSGFDYSVTFTAFIFFSLPAFVAATILKQYVAIGFNNWLADPVIPPVVIAVVALFGGLVLGSLTVGDRLQRLTAFAIGAGATAAVLIYLSVTRWFADPGLGLGLILPVSLIVAFTLTVLLVGLRSKGPLIGAGVTALIGSALYYPLFPLLNNPTWPLLIGLAVVTVAVGAGVGFLFGGLERRPAMRVSALVGLITAGMIFADHFLRAFYDYKELTFNRPIATVGSNTPNFSGSFWQVTMDSATHLLLPTMALILISLATYSRYSRSSMLEVMNQDYVRTARAKGLTERAVVVRHAFRNGLIPITTLAAFDFGGIIGGAVITEDVFAWRGMGRLFFDGLDAVDPNPVMAFFIVTGGAIVVFNMIADITYAYLDPRIRLS